MSSAGVPAKICIHCKQDCSTRPRTRDTQGRYLCKPCQDTLRARASAGAPPRPRTAPPAPPVAQPLAADDDHNLLSSMLDDAPDPCPQCGTPMGKGTVLCTACGFNKTSGTVATTRVAAPQKERRERVGGGGFPLSPTGLFWSYLVIQLAPAGLMLVNPSLQVVGAAVASLCYLALVITTIVVAFMTSAGAGALLIGTAILPWVCFFGLIRTNPAGAALLFLATLIGQLWYWLHFIFRHCPNEHVRSAWLAQVIVIVLALVMGVFKAISEFSQT